MLTIDDGDSLYQLPAARHSVFATPLETGTRIELAALTRDGTTLEQVDFEP